MTEIAHMTFAQEADVISVYDQYDPIPGHVVATTQQNIIFESPGVNIVIILCFAAGFYVLAFILLKVVYKPRG